MTPIDSFEVLFFGCKNTPGHYLHNRRGNCERYEMSPWGTTLDGGLLMTGKDYHSNKPDTMPTGNYVVARKDGWTCISFWDRSGDSRPASCSAFLVKAVISDIDLLTLAITQWPELFARPGFPLRVQIAPTGNLSL